jgi:adenine deaminase
MFTRLPVDRAALVEAARGLRPLDLAVKSVNLVNVLTCEIYPADIGVFDGRIAVVGPAGEYSLEAKTVIDGSGKWACPGFFDSHLHIESTMVTPAGYARGVLPLGTTSAVVDPHEIGNVMGKEGVKLMIEGSRDLPLRVYFAIPSCVPSVLGAETAGATFGPTEISEMMDWERVVSLAEVMDYIGVIKNDERMRGIVDAALARGVAIQGHAPKLMGRDLNAYIAAGIDNDHESRLGEEVLEKLRLGLLPLIKLGSPGNHLPRLMPKLLEAAHIDIALCTDDVEPSDLLTNGHMDRVVRGVMSYGVPVERALRWACYIGPQHYGMRDFGAIAPGFVADFLLLDSLQDVRTNDVFVGGRQIVRDRKLVEPIADPLIGRDIPGTVNIEPIAAEDFHIRAPVEAGTVQINAIELLGTRMTELASLQAEVEDGFIKPQLLPEGAIMATVVPRHGQRTKPVSVPLLGVGLTSGAIAHTVAHDCHNIMVAGRSDADMQAAVLELKEMGGGFALVDGGELVASVPLPFAGLMSFESCEELSERIEHYNVEVRKRGVMPESSRPIMALTGLPLAVIPAIRITDIHPLLDVVTQQPLSLFG